MPGTVPYVSRLILDFQRFEKNVLQLIEISTIREFRNDSDSVVVFITPTYYWGETDEKQKLLQMLLVNDYSVWIEHFKLLFTPASREIIKQIDEIDKFITSWIQKDSSWDIPSDTQKAKVVFSGKVKTVYDLFSLFATNEEAEIILVPDTNSLIAAPDVSQYAAVAGQHTYTIILVPTVLAELDKLKVVHREQEFRNKVNSVITRIKGLRTQGNLIQGVSVGKTITVKMIATEPKFTNTLGWLNSENADDRIIASVLEIQRSNPSKIVILTTSDINLQNKAEMANIPFAEPPGV